MLALFILLLHLPLHALELSYEDAHAYAVERARAGHHAEGVELLNRLRRQRPDYYPVIRDLLIIKTWQGRCRSAIKDYRHIQSYQYHESYLLVPASDCLWQLGSHVEAMQVIDDAISKKPGDKKLKQQQSKLRRLYADRRWWNLELEVSTNDSDAGNQEWLWQTLLNRELNDRLGVYLRYFIARADDPLFETADQDRAGLGARYRLTDSLLLAQEFSRDLGHSGANGSTTRIDYNITHEWQANAAYHSYAEDIPLRAKAVDISARSTHVGTQFHNSNYSWMGLLDLSRYSFSDSNERKSAYAELAYAFEIKPDREQRIVLEGSRSRNSLTGTVYYNPEWDHYAGVAYKLDIVYRSRFKRHVDHIYISSGRYFQENYDPRVISSIRYEQDYDLTEAVALVAGIGYGTRVYDGERERQTDGIIRLSWGF